MDNIQAIKSHLGEYMAEVGATPSKAGGKDMYTCPLCGSGVGRADGKRHTGAFHYEKNKQVWKCHSCGRGGTIIDLYGYINGIDQKNSEGLKTIIQTLKIKYNIEDTSSFNVIPAKKDFKDIPTPEEQAERDYIEEEINLCIRACEHTIGFSDYLTKRGISLEVQRRFNIGYFDEWLHPKTKYRHFGKIKREWLTPRIIIPTSECSYLARATTPEPPENDPRYKYYVKAYKVGDVHIFNSNALINNDGYCYIFEGEIDALSGIECGFNCIGLGSTSMIEKLFNDYEINKDMVLLLALDNDKAGQDNLQKLIEQAKAHGNYYIPVDSNSLFDGVKDCNEALQKDKKALIEHLEHYKQKALDLDKDTFYDNVTSMAEINNNIEDTPEITFENIETPEILNYIYALKTKPDILNYVQLLEIKAKEYKKLTKIAPIINKYKKEALKQLKSQEMQEKISSAPRWLYLDERNQVRINEPLFCKIKAQELQCKTINGNIRTIDGKQLDDAELLHQIQSEFDGNILNNIAKRSKQLLDALKNATFSKLPPYDNNIHFANGTYHVNTQSFENNKYWCINRLNVNYNNNAPRPTKWLNFLNELLNSDDIITLQEYLGYCLIQSTALQRMLFLIGSGGEGKSVIGKVLNALMGDNNVYIDKIHELQKNRFKLINLENKLLFIDDDLQTNALNDTGIIKTLITGGKSSLEPKGKPSYNAELYARGLCFGNIPLTALYDHSDGFYRRQIIIRTKHKPSNRATNFFLDQDIIKTELEGVLLWCLDGLHRLIDHNFNIFISKASEENLQEAKKNAFNFILFLEDPDQLEFDPTSEESATDIYANYCRYCADNGLDELKRRSVIDWLHTNEKEYSLKYSEHCHEYSTNKRVRGFKGIRLKKHYTYSIL